MKIGFDAKRIFYNQTGLGNYSRSLVQGLVQQYHSSEFHLYTPGVKLFPDFLSHQKNVHRHLPSGLINSKFSSNWRSNNLVPDLIRDEIEVFHGLSNELPKGIETTQIKSIATIHDLIFLHFPKQYPWLDLQIYKRKFASAINRADMVIATSQNTRKDILSFYGCSPEKVNVVYQDCDPVFSLPIDEAKLVQVKSKYGLNQNFILSVGTLENRKNHLRLLQAFEQANLKNMDIVFVGKKADAYPELLKFVEEKKLGSRIHFIHQVSFQDLPVIYKLARAAVYISTYEGFGIPVLEAMRVGTPVLASSTSSIAEVGGKAAYLVDPTDVSAICDGLLELNQNESLRESLLQNMPAHLKQFNSTTLCQQTMLLYESMVKQ
ncbi:MAG: hypothetical protein CFE21_13410 [Bacteroidetes bacterium B1(2017)]|nr:MAG: hypothetical protein CFE21_13410 [Bacteroidetes bacterium B1(2017)]